MKPLHYTASALALGLALMGNAQAVTTIPFWHSMEGELGKEVDSLAQRFNAYETTITQSAWRRLFWPVL